MIRYLQFLAFLTLFSATALSIDKYEILHSQYVFDSKLDYNDGKVYFTCTSMGHGEDITNIPALQGGMICQFDIENESIDWIDYFRTDTTQIIPRMIKFDENGNLKLYNKWSYGMDMGINSWFAGTTLGLYSYNRESDEYYNEPTSIKINQEGTSYGYSFASYFSMLDNGEEIIAFYDPVHSTITHGTYWYTFDYEGNFLNHGMADSIDIVSDSNYSHYNLRGAIQGSDGNYYGFCDRDVIKNSNQTVDTSYSYIVKFDKNKQLVWRNTVYSVPDFPSLFADIKEVDGRLLLYHRYDIWEMSSDGDYMIAGVHQYSISGVDHANTLILKTDKDFNILWHYEDKAMRGSQADQIIETSPGQYYFTEISGNEIGLVSLTEDFIVGVDDTPPKKTIIAYPNPINPNNETITIQTENRSDKLKSISIISTTGIATQITDYYYTDKLQLNIPQNIASGSYILSIEYTSGQQESVSIVVE